MPFVVKSIALKSSKTQTQPLTERGTLDKLLDLFEPSVSHLQNMNDNHSYLTGHSEIR